MSDYYSILGLTKNASIVEIKTAFRKLAKIYHPDKNPNNPNAKGLFENILVAYDVLSNPDKKRRYDYLISQSNATSSKNVSRAHQRQANKKNWDVTQDELKQRQYYKDYYNAKKKESNTQEQQTNKYSDYKYVMFATPIAVGLLLLIVSIFSKEPTAHENKAIKNVYENAVQVLKNGDKPYASYFGEPKTFETNNVLKINNSSGCDAVICVYENKTNNFLQYAYLQKDYLIEFSFLPNTGVYWKCMLGNHWDPKNTSLNKNVVGGFNEVVQFQNWEKKPIQFSNSETIEILTVLNENSKYIAYISDSNDFFRKQ